MIPPRDWNTPRAWLQRLAFSFLLLAGVLFYEAYFSPTPKTPTQKTLYTLLAALLLGLGLAGTKLRHRPPD